MAAWMGPIEKDSRGWHFNLHIENKNGETLANYHFYYLGWQDFEDHTGGYVWYVKDTDGTSVNYREPLLARNNWFALAATDVAVGMTIYIRNKFRLPEDFAKHLTGEDEFRWTRVFEEEFGTSNYLQDMLSRLGNYPVTKEKNL